MFYLIKINLIQCADKKSREGGIGEFFSAWKHVCSLKSIQSTMHAPLEMCYSDLSFF